MDRRPHPRHVRDRERRGSRDHRPLAFNQGFYNLFLAVIVITGAITTLAGTTEIGATLVYAGAGSMVAAGLVLLVSRPSKARPALIQLTPPLLGLIALTIGLAT